MPASGGGVYYFSASFVISNGEFARFDLRQNGDVICSSHGDSPDGQWGIATCSAVITVSEGMQILQHSFEISLK